MSKRCGQLINDSGGIEMRKIKSFFKMLIKIIGFVVAISGAIAAYHIYMMEKVSTERRQAQEDVRLTQEAALQAQLAEDIKIIRIVIQEMKEGNSITPSEIANNLIASAKEKYPNNQEIFKLEQELQAAARPISNVIPGATISYIGAEIGQNSILYITYMITATKDMDITVIPKGSMLYDNRGNSFNAGDYNYVYIGNTSSYDKLTREIKANIPTPIQVGYRHVYSNGKIASLFPSVNLMVNGKSVTFKNVTPNN